MGRRLLEPRDGISEDLHVALDLAGEPSKLLLLVEDLDPLGVRVVKEAERPLQGGRILPDLVLGILEGVSHKVEGLVLRDRVLLNTGLEGIKGDKLRLGAQAVLFSDRVKG